MRNLWHEIVCLNGNQIGNSIWHFSFAIIESDKEKKKKNVNTIERALSHSNPQKQRCDRMPREIFICSEKPFIKFIDCCVCYLFASSNLYQQIWTTNWRHHLRNLRAKEQAKENIMFAFLVNTSEYPFVDFHSQRFHTVRFFACLRSIWVCAFCHTKVVHEFDLMLNCPQSYCDV